MTKKGHYLRAPNKLNISMDQKSHRNTKCKRRRGQKVWVGPGPQTGKGSRQAVGSQGLTMSWSDQVARAPRELGRQQALCWKSGTGVALPLPCLGELEQKRFLLTALRPQGRKRLTSCQMTQWPNLWHASITGPGPGPLTQDLVLIWELWSQAEIRAKLPDQQGKSERKETGKENSHHKKTPMPAKLQNMMSTPIISTTRT